MSKIKKLQASTMKNYLTSFEKLISYLSFKKLAGFDAAKEQSCMNIIMNWKRSYSKDVSVRRAKEANKDRGTLFLHHVIDTYHGYRHNKMHT